MSNINWQLMTFSDLNATQMYKILSLRCEVFIVEQNCPYQDIDGYDEKAWHLLGLNESGDLEAYMRIFAPGAHYEQASMGRIVTAPSSRGKNLGKLLLAKGLESLESLFQTTECKIQAQSYLKKFYQSYGFRQISEEYLEDDIPHIDMLRTADNH